MHRFRCEAPDTPRHAVKHTMSSGADFLGKMNISELPLKFTRKSVIIKRPFLYDIAYLWICSGDRYV
jgi:hypothetical protein